jgi:hypothetical protein
MNVPPAKVQQYLDDGWMVLQPADEMPSVKPAPVVVETIPAANEAPAVVDEKPKGRKSKKK